MMMERFGKGLHKVRVAVLGLAFKPGTNDFREAPGVKLASMLVSHGATVSTYDPAVDPKAVLRELPEHIRRTLRFCDSPEEACIDTHAIVLATEWPQIVSARWGAISKEMCDPRLLFDGRNALDSDRMTALGFEYIGVGQQPNGKGRNTDAVIVNSVGIST